MVGFHKNFILIQNQLLKVVLNLLLVNKQLHFSEFWGENMWYVNNSKVILAPVLRNISEA